MAKKDYYDILSVPRNTDQAQIKKAYRRLARKYHPDINKDPNAIDKFKEIQEAYQVLSDKDKRAAYDQFGQAGVGMGAGAASGRWTYGPGGARVYYSSGNQPGGFDFDVENSRTGSGRIQDIFEQFFGAGAGQRRKTRKPTDSRGRNIEQEITLGFEQALWGTTLRLQIDRPGARGSTHKQTIDVKIPPGVKDGSRIRIKGKGHPAAGGAAPGDLYIVVRIKPHQYFRRLDNDIYLDVPITVAEAVLGAKITMPTIDGPTNVTIPPGTSSGQKLRLRNKGAPDSKTKVRGDQYAVIRIVVPESVDKHLESALRELDRTGDNPRKDLPWAI